jgi:hypothetical protein
MSRSISRVLTIALMTGILWAVGYTRRELSTRAQPTSGGELHESRATPDSAAGAPDSVVWRMLDAARAGDPARYLECYTGEMQPRLRRDFEEMGSARSGTYLLDAHRRLKGVAVRLPRMSSPIQAQIPVEYVYEDRNEVQQFHVKKVGGVWKIERVEGAERIKTLVPYGAPVEG